MQAKENTEIKPKAGKKDEDLNLCWEYSKDSLTDEKV